MQLISLLSFIILCLSLLDAKASVDYVQLESDLRDSLGKLYQIAPLLPRTEVYVTSCGEANAYYDYWNNEIVICKELVDLTYQVDEDNFGQTSGNYVAYNAIKFFFWHEVGHYLIDKCNLPVLGKEEDAADSFSVYASLYLENNPDIAISGAYTFIIFTQYGLDSAYWDEHSFDLQRAYNILCWVYGSNPENFSFIVNAFPQLQGRNCSLEYERTILGWGQQLKECSDKYSIDLNTVNPLSVSMLYISLLGRSPDGEGLFYWLRVAKQRSLSIDALARSMYFAALNYPEYSYLQDPFLLVNSIYENVLNKDYTQDPDGVTYWVNQIAQGKIDPGDIALVIARTAIQQYPNHPSTITLINRAIGGLDIASILLKFNGDFDIYRQLNLSINDSTDSIDYAVKQALSYREKDGVPEPLDLIDRFKKLNYKLNGRKVLVVINNGDESVCSWVMKSDDPLKFRLTNCEDPSFNDYNWEEVYLLGTEVVVSDGYTQVSVVDVDETQGLFSVRDEEDGLSAIVGVLR